MFEQELIVVKEAMKKASQAILEVYAKEDFGVQIKGDDSPVTLADKAANEIIIQTLESVFPEYAYLSEESAENPERFYKPYVWVIDPLDGTKEFIKRNGDFSINIALVTDQRPVLGVVYMPLLKVFYYAIQGEGAFREYEGQVTPIQVSDRTENLHMLRSRSRVGNKLMSIYEDERVATLQKLGSAYKGCRIAEGSADMYYSFGFTMEWDTCAIDLIVKEAGGIFRQLTGEDFTYNRQDNLNREGFMALNKEENNFL